MSEPEKSPFLSIGIDVAKEHLDIHVRPQGRVFRLTNDSKGHEELLTIVTPLQPSLIVLEASGGFQAALVALLCQAQLPVAVVNPRQVRDFARAKGLLAKTDLLDAAVLAEFGEAIRPAARPLPPEKLSVLHELVTRRQQVVAMLTAERNRAQVSTRALKKSIQSHMEWLRTDLAALEKDIEEEIKNSDLWRAKDAILQSIKRIGPAVSAVLLCPLPELRPCRRSLRTAWTPRARSALRGTAPARRTYLGDHFFSSRTWSGDP